jgi:LysM repeat protein
MDGRNGYRTGPHPRHLPRQRNPLPYIAAAVGALVLVVAGLGLVIAHPWASDAAPTPTPSPLLTLPPGQSLTDVLPSLFATPTEEITAAPPTEDAVPTPTPMIYVVKAGDTFSRIAARFGLTLAELRAANPQITNINSIHVGQTIYIPVAPAEPPAAAS